jgi:hypothetical protein
MLGNWIYQRVGCIRTRSIEKFHRNNRLLVVYSSVVTSDYVLQHQDTQIIVLLISAKKDLFLRSTTWKIRLLELEIGCPSWVHLKTRHSCKQFQSVELSVKSLEYTFWGNPSWCFWLQRHRKTGRIPTRKHKIIHGVFQTLFYQRLYATETTSDKRLQSI